MKEALVVHVRRLIDKWRLALVEAPSQTVCLGGLGIQETSAKPLAQRYHGSCGAAMLPRWQSLDERRLSNRTPPDGATIRTVPRRRHRDIVQSKPAVPTGTGTAIVY